MPRTQTTSENLKDGAGVKRADLDVTGTGSAVIAKAVGSANIALSSTGVDAGTGDVTFNLTTTGVGAGTYTKCQVDIYGRVISASNLVAGDLPSGSTFYVQNQNASPQAATNLWISGVASATELRAYNGAGTFYVSVTAPAGIAANFTFALPASYGSNGNVLAGNGSGGLSWVDLTTVYVPIGGISTITGAKTFSAGISTASILVSNLATAGASLPLVSDTLGNVSFQTASTFLATIGAQAALTNPVTGTGAGVALQVPVFTGANAIEGVVGFTVTKVSSSIIQLSVGDPALTTNNAFVVANGADARYKLFRASTSGSARGGFGTDNTAETGSNAGSNIIIQANSDAGGIIDNPVSIARISGGTIALGGLTNRPVTMSGTL